MKLFLLTMETGRTVYIETELDMMELSNELRRKARVCLKQTDQQLVEISGQDVQFIERVYRGVR